MHNRKIVLFGCGSTGKEAVAFYGKSKIYAFCDNYYEANTYEGIPVISPGMLNELDMSIFRIVIALKNKEFIRDVRSLLDEMNLSYSFFYNEYLDESGLKNKFLIDNQIGRKVELSITDLLHCNMKNSELLRMDTIVRFLAISDYFNGKDMVLYKQMQDCRIGGGYGEEATNKFIELIQSYDINGYDKESRITVDRNLQIIDGSHRIAMALYYELPCISAVIIDTDYVADYGIDWFISNGFSTESLQRIIGAANAILEKHIPVFSFSIWSPATDFSEEIIGDIECFGKVKGVLKHKYKPMEYVNIIKSVYSIDDIAKWKVNKKIDYMRYYNPQMVTGDIEIQYPEYRFKDSTGQPLSTKVEKIKYIIREKYKERLSEYFHDIIIHIADNVYQSDFTRIVYEGDIGFERYIRFLNNYEYAFTKVNVPFFPDDFPKHIPIGKDIDILCNKEDINNIVEGIIRIAKKRRYYDIQIINENGGTRIRLHWGKALIYQFDLRYLPDGVNDKFVKEALNQRENKGGYYVLDNKYECILRTQAFMNDRSKVYHKDYILSYISEIDLAEIEKYCSDNLIYELVNEQNEVQITNK